MENMNNQGKTQKQYTDSTRFAWYGVVGMILLVILLTLLGGCATTHDTSKECCKTKKTSTKQLGEAKYFSYLDGINKN